MSGRCLISDVAARTDEPPGGAGRVQVVSGLVDAMALRAGRHQPCAWLVGRRVGSEAEQREGRCQWDATVERPSRKGMRHSSGYAVGASTGCTALHVLTGARFPDVAC
jgi:hypothetical protein